MLLLGSFKIHISYEKLSLLMKNHLQKYHTFSFIEKKLLAGLTAQTAYLLDIQNWHGPPIIIFPIPQNPSTICFEVSRETK
jgi:hypothetical protein